MAIRFLVIDEADRMIERGHFQELESILLLLPKPTVIESVDPTATAELAPVYRTKRQTFIFSATLTISAEARQKIGKFRKPIFKKKNKKKTQSSYISLQLYFILKLL